MELKTVNPVVFDDAEKCGQSTLKDENSRMVIKKCDYADVDRCRLFPGKRIKYHRDLSPPYFVDPHKHEECREHYLKNKTQ